MSADEAVSARAPAVLDSLTSLRFFAAAAVFSLHVGIFLGPLMPNVKPYARVTYAGPTGVGFFFILSGFVLTWSAGQAVGSGGFFRRRAARILPNHVLTWAAMLAILLALDVSVSTGPAVTSLLLVHAWVPHQSYFGAVNTPSWSLSCEAFFYALFPLLLIGVRRAGVLARRLLLLVAVAVPLAVAIAEPSYADRLDPTAKDFFVSRFPPVRLAEFVIGIVLAVEVRAGRVPRIPLSFAVALAVGAFAAVDVLHDGRWQVVVTLVPFAVLIVAAARSDLRRSASLLRLPWLVRAGQWSYALYLVHWPVLVLVAHFHKTRFASGTEALGAVAVVFAGCVVLAGLVFTLWERPWEVRLRPEHRPPAALRNPQASDRTADA
ncbi:MAG: hypothetical protein QOJ03_2655 [Frankiaceae bacterium]|jgi:peptidoglycan/LPS O-acetylase OafA/YrhL|nr:hypothetical protein [Frankiaceae bacterium]